jgi:phosphatidylglycerophosphate synthase
MVAAVLVMLMASRRADGDAPIIQDWSVIPALIILLREIMVSGLREHLAPLQVLVPVSALAKWKTTFQLVSLGALILGGAFPSQHWIHLVGLSCLWAAAALTLITGYDYLRLGLKHMD